MKKSWIILGVAVAVLLALISMYNRFVSLDETIKNEWAQVENQLQRRADLIPNLVSTVKGYAKHEKTTFENIATARAKLAGAASISDKIKANQELDSALSRLLMVVEQYPNLKANENFIRLQDELSGTENRIAVARMRYNESVKSYNIIIKRFPSNIIASLTNFKEKDAYLKADERAKTAPKVEF
jgi:LemA protein